MMILAIDPATNSGFCRGTPNGTPSLLTQRFRVSPRDEKEDVFGRALTFFERYFDEQPPDVIAIERPIAKAWGKTTRDTTEMLLGLYGVFAGAAKSRGVRLLVADVSTWRKSFLGRGNLSTQDAKAACVNQCRMLRWALPDKADHNAAEAAGIWHWACCQAAPAGRRTDLLAGMEAA